MLRNIKSLPNKLDLFGIGIFFVVVVSTYSKLKFNGLVFSYKFDYGLYQPDGVHYAYRTLTFLGKAPLDASQQVVEWYQSHASKGFGLPLDSLIPQNNAVWDLVAPRYLYPILSMPFVFFLGIKGMLVVPIISYFVFSLMIYISAKKISSPAVGFGLVFLLTCSPTLSRWMLVDCTDSLLAAIFSIVSYQLIKSSNGINQISILILIFFSTQTRFCLPIWIAILGVLFLHQRKKFPLIALVFSVICTIPTYLYSTGNSVLPGLANASIIKKIGYFPISMLKIAVFEIGELIILDRILFMSIIIGFLLAVRFYKDLNSQMYLAVLLSVWIIGAINGTVGVNFRYQLPVIPFTIVLFAKWLQKFDLKNSIFYSNNKKKIE